MGSCSVPLSSAHRVGVLYPKLENSLVKLSLDYVYLALHVDQQAIHWGFDVQE